MKYFSHLILMLSFPMLSFAQNEFGIFLGATAYQGDLVQPVISPKGAGITGGLLYKYYLDDKVALRGSFNVGQFSGDDEFFDDDPKNRGFSFTSNFIDASVALEYSIFGKGGFTPSGSFEKVFSPYIYLGFGFMNVNPEVTTDGRIAFNSEDNDPQSLHKMFPVGVGLKYDITSRLNLAGEFSLRNPLTDLIDGISKSGNPGDYDWYWTTGLTLVYRLGDERPIKGMN